MGNPIPTPDDVVLTTGGAATYYKVEPQTVRKWRGKGCGPRYFRLGGAKGPARYFLSDLIAWADARSASSTSEESVRRNAAHDDALELSATNRPEERQQGAEAKGPPNIASTPASNARKRATDGRR